MPVQFSKLTCLQQEHFLDVRYLSAIKIMKTSLVYYTTLSVSSSQQEKICPTLSVVVRRKKFVQLFTSVTFLKGFALQVIKNLVCPQWRGLSLHVCTSMNGLKCSVVMWLELWLRQSTYVYRRCSSYCQFSLFGWGWVRKRMVGGGGGAITSTKSVSRY